MFTRSPFEVRLAMLTQLVPSNRNKTQKNSCNTGRPALQCAPNYLVHVRPCSQTNRIASRKAVQEVCAHSMCFLAAPAGVSSCPGIEGSNDGQVVTLGCCSAGSQAGASCCCLSPLVRRRHKDGAAVCHGSHNGQDGVHTPASSIASQVQRLPPLPVDST